MERNLPEVIAIPFNKGKVDVKVNIAKWDTETIVDLMRHGLRQKANDAYASVVKDLTDEMVAEYKKRHPQATKADLAELAPSDEDILAESRRRFGAALAKVAAEGFRLGENTGGTLSPVEAEIRRIVAENLMASHWKSRADAEKLARGWRTLVPKEQHETLRQKAEENVKARAVPELTINI